MTRWLAILLSISAFSTRAADVVLRIGPMAEVHRIPYASIARIEPEHGDIVVRPLAAAGTPGDGWCPTNGGVAVADGPSIVLQLAGGVLYRIPIASSASIDTTTGDIEATPVAASGVSGDAWCALDGGSSDQPPTFSTAFIASPSNLHAGGGIVSLSWAVDGAVSCVATSSPQVPGWNGNVPVSATVQVQLNVSGTYTFELTCSDVHAVVSARRTVVMAPPPPAVNCVNRPAPAGLTRQTSMVNTPALNNDFPSGATISLTTYVPIFGPVFGSPGQSAYVFVEQNKFAAMQLSPGTLPTGTTGEIRWEHGGASGGPLWVMISPCPGDFEFNTDQRCKFWGNAAMLTWVIGPGSPQPNWACPLEPGRQYFVNAVFSSNSSYTTTSCAGARCNWVVTNIGQPF